MKLTKLELKLLGWTVVVALVGFLLLNLTTENIVVTEQKTFSWANLWAWASLAYIIFSYRFINPVETDKNGVITFFKRPVGERVGAGPVFAPLFVFQVRKETSLAIQKEFPGEPQSIFRGEMKDKKELPEGMVPPIRIQFAKSIPENKAEALLGEDFIAERRLGGALDKDVKFYAHTETGDGLAKRVTAEPFPVVRFMIEDVAAFVRNIGSVEDALIQIEDEMFSVLTRLYTKISVAQALQNIEWANIHLYNALERRVGIRGDLKPWGIALQDAYVKYIYTSHGVNQAIAAAASAPFQKQSTVIAAEASRRRKILEGEGDASAAGNLQRQTLDAQTEALKKRAAALGIKGEEAIAQFVAEQLAKGDGTFIVGTEGFGQLLTLGSTFAKKQNGGEK